MLSDRSKQNNEGGKLQAMVIAVRERAHSECGVPASNQQPKKSNPTPGYLRHYGSGYRWNYRLSGELRAEMERGIATSPEVRKATGGSGKLMKAVSSKSTAIVVLQHTPYQPVNRSELCQIRYMGAERQPPGSIDVRVESHRFEYVSNGPFYSTL